MRMRGSPANVGTRDDSGTTSAGTGLGSTSPSSEVNSRIPDRVRKQAVIARNTGVLDGPSSRSPANAPYARAAAPTNRPATEAHAETSGMSTSGAIAGSAEKKRLVSPITTSAKKTVRSQNVRLARNRPRNRYEASKPMKEAVTSIATWSERFL